MNGNLQCLVVYVIYFLCNTTKHLEYNKFVLPL